MPSRDVEINLIGNDRTGAATRSAANNLDQLARKIDKFNAKTIGDKRATVKTKVDNSAAAASANKLKQTFAKAGDQAGQSFVSRLKNRIRGFNPDFGRVVDTNRRIFARAGDQAGASFGSRFRTRMGQEGPSAAKLLVAGLLEGATGGFIRSKGLFASSVKTPLTKAFGTVGVTVGAVFAAKVVTTAASTITAGLALALPAALLAGPIAFMLSQQAKASKETLSQEKRVAALRKRLNNATNKDTKERLQKQLTGEQRVLDEMRKESQQWDNIKTKAKAFMTTISAPLKVPLQDSINAVFKGLDALKVPVTDLMKALGPALVPFTKGVMQGLLNFVNALKPAIPGMVAGFKEWGKQIANIGTALGKAFAKILSDPKKVVGAIRAVSGIIQGLIGIIATLVSWLTSADQLWAKWGSGFNVGTMAGKAAIVQNAFLSMTIAIIGAVQKVLPAVATMVSFMGRAFVGIIEAWNALPFTKNIDTGPLKAFTTAFENEVPKWVAALEGYKTAAKGAQNALKIKANISDLKSKLAEAKAKLKDPNLSKTKKIQIKANIADIKLKIATAKAELTSVSKHKTLAKLQATKKDLEAKVKSAKASLKGVHDKKTIAKIKGDIKDAEAKLKKIKAEIAGIHGKTVSVHVNSVFTTTRTVKTNRLVRVKNVPPSAGSSWQGALSGGATSRTDPPSVSVAAPEVSTRVFLDSREIQVVARSTVREANNRDTWRARTGRR